MEVDELEETVKPSDAQDTPMGGRNQTSTVATEDKGADSPAPLSQNGEANGDVEATGNDDGEEDEEEEEDLVYVEDKQADNIPSASPAAANAEVLSPSAPLPSTATDALDIDDILVPTDDAPEVAVNSGDQTMDNAESSIPGNAGDGASDDLAALRNELKQVKDRLHTAELQHDEILHDQSLQTQRLEEELQQSTQSYNQLQTANTQLQKDHEATLRELASLKEIVERHAAPENDEDTLARVEDLESEKRDLLNVVNSLEAEKQELQDSLDFMRTQQKSVTESLRTAEAGLITATEAAKSARLKASSLETDNAALVRDRDWHKQELTSIESAAKQYRQEKHVQIVQLTSQLSDASQKAESSTHSLNALKISHSALEARLTDALAQLADLRGIHADAEATFQRDMAAQRHLVSLLTKRDDEGRQRLEAVEAEWQTARDSIEAREETLNNALEKERQRSERLEKKVNELRVLAESRSNQIQTLDGDVDESFDNSAVFATPRSSIGPSHAQHTLGLSPAASIAARMQRGGRSYTDVYSDYVKLEAELNGERAEVSRLTECLSSILADIEDRAPILREQRQEYERAISECQVLATDLAQAGADRDAAKHRADNAEAEADAARREVRLMGQSLRDLGRQTRELVRVLALAQNPSVVNDMELENGVGAFENDMDSIVNSSSLDETGTDSIISSELVTFRSVSQLQANNQKLLRITREMGRQMEMQDQALRERIERTENDAVKEAHELILSLKEEVQTSRVNMDAISRERDMLRRLVTASGTPQNALARSTGQPHGASEDTADVRKQLAESQASFEAYRTEITQDMQQLKIDLSRAQRECRDAEVASAKAQSQMDFLRERLRLANEAQERSGSETAQLNKSMARLQASLAKQDEAVHQVNEQVLSLRFERDRLQNDLRNLQSEREAWKATEARVTSENTGLQRERAQLSELMRNLQSMQGELERTSTESKSRLEEQVQRLTASLDDTKMRLSQESAAHRQLVLRRDVETKDLRDKREILTNELAKTREALAVSKSSQTHLEQRIVDLTANITAKEDKLAIYEGRSSGSHPRAVDQSLSREQQLELELAELRASLRAAQVESQQARSHVEQFKAISEANESALSSLNATYDEYKTQTEAELAAKESTISSLREDLTTLSGDLSKASTDISALHEDLAKKDSAAKTQLGEIEQEMRQLQEAATTARAEQDSARADLKVQAQAAAEAHQKYENELIAHAEDVRALSTMKEQMASLRSQLSEQSEMARTSEANLLASQSSWEAQRAALHKELDDVRKRFEDLRSQNSALHDHLAEVTAQATKIQRANADSMPVNGDAAESSQLPQVVQFLRNERDILEMQLQVEKQETARLTAKLEHNERSLDQTRAQLTEERNAAAQSTSLNVQHDELLAKVTQLNILRESNDTLRMESERHANKVRSLSEQVQRLNNEIVPLRGQVASLQAEIEARDGHIRLLNEDNARWKARNEQVLAKYERIDPAELQTLKDDVQRLNEENAKIQSERDNAATSLSQAQEEMRSRLSAITAERDNLENRVQELQQQMSQAAEAASTEQSRQTTMIEAARMRFANLQGTARGQREQITQLTTDKQSLEKEKQSLLAENKTLQEASNSTTNAKESREAFEKEQQAKQDELNAKVTAATEQTSAAQAECASLRAAKDSLEKQVNDLRQDLEAAKAAGPDQATIDAKVSEKMLEIQMANAEKGSDEDGKQQLDQLRGSMAAEKDNAIQQARSEIEATFTSRVSSYENEIQTLKASVEAARDATTKAVDEAVAKVKTEQAGTAVSQQELKRLEAEVQKSTSALNEVRSQLSKAQEQLAASRSKEAELEKQKQNIQQALDKAKSASADESAMQQRIDAALSAERIAFEVARGEREQQHARALEDAKTEGEKKIATWKAQVSSLRATNNQIKAEIAALKAANAGADVITATPSNVPAPPTPAAAPVNVLNIRGKASEIPPPPQPKKARQASATSPAGSPGGTPAAATAPVSAAAAAGSTATRGSARGRGARGASRGGRGGAAGGVNLLGNALQQASESAAAGGPAVIGSPGGPSASSGKRARPDDDAAASGDESAKRARGAGPVTRAQNA